MITEELYYGKILHMGVFFHSHPIFGFFDDHDLKMIKSKLYQNYIKNYQLIYTNI